MTHVASSMHMVTCHSHLDDSHALWREKLRLRMWHDLSRALGKKWWSQEPGLALCPVGRASGLWPQLPTRWLKWLFRHLGPGRPLLSPHWPEGCSLAALTTPGTPEHRPHRRWDGAENWW